MPTTRPLTQPRPVISAVHFSALNHCSMKQNAAIDLAPCCWDLSQEHAVVLPDTAGLHDDGTGDCCHWWLSLSTISAHSDHCQPNYAPGFCDADLLLVSCKGLSRRGSCILGQVWARCRARALAGSRAWCLTACACPAQRLLCSCRDTSWRGCCLV